MTRTTAIVTGAARGIGLSTTQLFLAEGRRVVMIDRDADVLAEAAAALPGAIFSIWLNLTGSAFAAACVRSDERKAGHDRRGA